MTAAPYLWFICVFFYFFFYWGSDMVKACELHKYGQLCFCLFFYHFYGIFTWLCTVCRTRQERIQRVMLRSCVCLGSQKHSFHKTFFFFLAFYISIVSLEELHAAAPSETQTHSLCQLRVHPQIAATFGLFLSSDGSLRHLPDPRPGPRTAHLALEAAFYETQFHFKFAYFTLWICCY